MIPRLQYQDLIDTSDERFPVFDPSLIPIHPAVLRAPETYTPEFMARVKQRLPKALRADLEIIADSSIVDGFRWNMVEEGYTVNGDVVFFNDGRYEANPTEYRVTLGVHGHRIWVEPSSANMMEVEVASGRPTTNKLLFKSPIPQPVAEAYAYRTGGRIKYLHTWNLESEASCGTAAFHFLRTAAIAFNNVGLDRLNL